MPSQQVDGSPRRRSRTRPGRSRAGCRRPRPRASPMSSRTSAPRAGGRRVGRARQGGPERGDQRGRGTRRCAVAAAVRPGGWSSVLRSVAQMVGSGSSASRMAVVALTGQGRAVGAGLGRPATAPPVRRRSPGPARRPARRRRRRRPRDGGASSSGSSLGRSPCRVRPCPGRAGVDPDPADVAVEEPERAAAAQRDQRVLPVRLQRDAAVSRRWRAGAAGRGRRGRRPGRRRTRRRRPPGRAGGRRRGTGRPARRAGSRPGGGACRSTTARRRSGAAVVDQDGAGGGLAQHREAVLEAGEERGDRRAVAHGGRRDGPHRAGQLDVDRGLEVVRGRRAGRACAATSAAGPGGWGRRRPGVRPATGVR